MLRIPTPESAVFGWLVSCSRIRDWSGSCSSCSSDVSPPPLGPASLEAAIPTAGIVEDGDSYGPDQVQQWKTPGVSLGRWWRGHRMVGEQPCADLAQPYSRHDQREHV